MAFVSSTGRVAAAAQRYAATAGFTADLAWERCQEQAAIAFRAGDTILPSRLWAEALAIARKRFGRGDPRLASSLTNQALVLRRRGQEYQARMLFQEALGAWDDSWRWIHLMTPCRAPVDPRRADRLEFYGPAARAWFNALARQGRAATVALEHRDERLAIGLEDWFALKPKRLSDLRRLLGAVLLIAPKPRA
ncbi:MAG: tetratricopeptide repeat protein [Geminicoccaceae bacterium]